jgi:hypothetical protein
VRGPQQLVATTRPPVGQTALGQGSAGALPIPIDLCSLAALARMPGGEVTDLRGVLRKLLACNRAW